MRQPSTNSSLRGQQASTSKPHKRVAIMLDLVWPYRRHCDIYAGIQQFAQECGNWDCYLDEFADATLAQSVKSRPAYDGIIARATPALARQATKFGVPLVNVWFNSPVTKDLYGVFSDPHACGQLAAEHLLKRGFRQFACISSSDFTFFQRDKASFCQAIQSRGYTCKTLEIPSLLTSSRAVWKSVQRKLTDWITSWRAPLGVYCCVSSSMGRYVADACRRLGVVIPDHAALVSSDSEPSICLQPAPSLTTVDINFNQIGYASAFMLEQMMSGNAPQVRHRYLRPTGISARQSTDFYAVEDELVSAALRFISTNLRKPIGVNAVCAKVFCSRRTLERRFRRVLGRSVVQEIVRLRVERAKRELAASNSSLKSVAHAAGFPDAKRMYEVFQREEGLGPSEYRAKLKAE